MNSKMHNLKHLRGFSLVELMVAVVIGLIGTLVMFQVFATSEGQKRTTVSGGDSTQNGAIALFTIENDIRNSGHGLDDLIPRGQPLYTWSNPAGAPLARTLFRPFLITPGTTSDTIEVNYSTHSGLGVPNPLAANWLPAVAPSPNIALVSSSGLQNGDHIAICAPLSDPTGVCLQAEITAVLPNSTISIAPPPATYINQDGIAVAPINNPTAGFTAALGASATADGLAIPATFVGTSVKDDSVAFNLGNLVTRIYRVQNGQLQVNDSGVVTDFADGIVAIKAQYGLDTNADRAVDTWVNPRGVEANPFASYTPNSPTFLIGSNLQIAQSWRTVLAARVAIVTRSNTLEKTVVESRGSIPLWANPVGNAVQGPSYAVPGGDGNRYRYQVFETIIPLRNMIW